jgi:hypothetical protein
MTAEDRTVHCRRVVFELLPAGCEDVPAVAVRVDLTYDADDPLAVRAAFRTGGKPVCWLLGRDLLAAGLNGRAGHGDVQVRPLPGRARRLLVSLSSPDGVALLRVDAAELAGFLDDTFRVVPQGTEYPATTVDAALAALLDHA